MARLSTYFLALATVAASVYLAAAVPIESRQIGDVACNVARLKTVAGLAATTGAVKRISAASAGDATVASGANAAQSGLNNASSGIKTIAGALITGQTAPASARDQVQQGLLAAQTALSGISSTSSDITSLVSTAQEKLAGTISAGEDVVSQCGGSAPASSSSNTAAVDTATPAAANPAASNTEPAKPKGLFGRQIGDLSCNVARLQTVTRLAASVAAVKEVSNAGKGDSATTSAATTAQAGLSSAQSAIGTIAAAIITGRQAPASARVQVQAGLTSAQNALSGITSTSSAVKSAVANAQSELESTQTAGNSVVSNCK